MRISKLSPSKRIKDRWLVWLENGDILRVSENEIADFGLYAGLELTAEQLETLTAAAGNSAVKAKALDLISAKPLSRKELVDKLTAPVRSREGMKPPKFTPEQAEFVADWLTDLGYLNDAEYGRLVVRHYANRQWGPARLRQELYRRGVPREYWDEALAEAADPADGIEAFLAGRFRHRKPDEKERKRAADALARRGYRWEDIKSALRQYETEYSDWD